MRAYACKTGGVWGHAPPGIFDALRLLLKPLSDTGRAVVAAWLTNYFTV